jgi:hypothetical protein
MKAAEFSTEGRGVVGQGDAVAKAREGSVTCWGGLGRGGESNHLCDTCRQAEVNSHTAEGGTASLAPALAPQL